MANPKISSFTQLNLAPELLRAIDEIGYELPSPIQAESIPPLLAGRDLLGQAQTGTGKTAAYALPILSRLDLTLTQPQVLVLTPTRELTIQVAEAMQTYARYLEGFHVAPVYGGQSIATQLRQLKRGVQAVVGTPGRILDHLRRGTLKLGKLMAVVLDEADEMLRMGFLEDVDLILQQTPSTRQVALFSATMPKAIQRVAQQHLKDPIEIRIESKTTTVATINQRYWQVSGVNKLDALTRILEVEDFEAMLVFVRTKLATVELTEKLEARGYTSAMLNGDINQTLREKTVERLKRGALDIVVATDVAARGLDVERISHVVNYDIPYDTETYVHRIGRTGRAGRSGEAILFISPRERGMLRSIEKATRQPIQQMELPTQADIADRRVAQFKQLVTETVEAQDLSFFQALIKQYQEEQDLSLTDVAAALAFLAQRERPLQTKGEKQEPSRSTPGRKNRVPSSDWPANGEGKSGDGRRSLGDMQCYRLEVGRQDGINPKHIVGAIANEADLDSKYIGEIQLFDSYSTVDLPASMPQETLTHLQKVEVCGQPMRLSPCEKPPGKRPSSRQKVDKPGRHKTDKKRPKREP